jgi:primosomal replication protein N
VHSSAQAESGAMRQTEFEIAVVALGQSAQWLEAVAVGAAVRMAGFLAAKSRHSRTLVLHVNSIEFLEGNENGSILQEEG